MIMARIKLLPPPHWGTGRPHPLGGTVAPHSIPLQLGLSVVGDFNKIPIKMIQDLEIKKLLKPLESLENFSLTLYTWGVTSSGVVRTYFIKLTMISRPANLLLY